MLEVIAVVREQETDDYQMHKVYGIYTIIQVLLSQLYSVTQPLIC